MQKKSKLLITLLLLSGALFGCGQTSEQPSESNSDNIQNSETSPNLPSDDSSTSEIEDTQLLTVKQEASTSLDNYLDLNNYRQAQKEEIASIIENAKSSILDSEHLLQNTELIKSRLSSSNIAHYLQLLFE